MIKVIVLSRTLKTSIIKQKKEIVMNLFRDVQFLNKTKKYIELEGFTEPTEIQKAVIPTVLKGKDVIGISDTGTGKTHAFLIPIMEKIRSDVNTVQAVVTAPTRELAMQIFNRAKLMIKADPQLRISLVTGGMDREKMADSMKVQPHLVIGTPGRIKDLFLQEEVLRIDTAHLLVVDEADMTLEFGFLEDIDAIASRMSDPLQMLAFSATIPQGLKPFLKKYMRQPQTIKVDIESNMNPKIQHILVPCKHRSYTETLLQIMPGFMPYVCLIFANTREDAAFTAEELRKNNVKVIEIHGGLQPRQRRQAMKQLETADHAYIVATDIAARGIDMDGITHVVSLGFPNELDFYTHRSGRTGRSGREGTCFALYMESDVKVIQQLKERGTHFTYQTFKNGEWQSLKVVHQKKISKLDQREKELSKQLHRKNEKVKPGYKKKKAEIVKKMRQKEHRTMIQQEIQSQRKERYKAQQRLKSGENDG